MSFLLVAFRKRNIIEFRERMTSCLAKSLHKVISGSQYSTSVVGAMNYNLHTENIFRFLRPKFPYVILAARHFWDFPVDLRSKYFCVSDSNNSLPS